ncbi:MAG: hypothetical protein HYR71_05115 [Chloroflexi bacterium]|nr:hypothetical protein [Chloroflexota bacterium]
MLKGEKVILRAIQREDLKRQWEFNNDVEVELSGGGDPPMPQSLAPDWIGGEFDENARKGGRDGALFAIEADGLYIGQCGVFTSGIIGSTAQTYELGIAIGDKRYWGRAPDPVGGRCRARLARLRFSTAQRAQSLAARQWPQRARHSRLSRLRVCRRRPPAPACLGRRAVY